MKNKVKFGIVDPSALSLCGSKDFRESLVNEKELAPFHFTGDSYFKAFRANRAVPKARITDTRECDRVPLDYVPYRQPRIKSLLIGGILLNDGDGFSTCYPPSAKTNTIRKLQVIELVRELSLFLLRGGDKLAFLTFFLPFLRLLNHCF